MKPVEEVAEIEVLGSVAQAMVDVPGSSSSYDSNWTGNNSSVFDSDWIGNNSSVFDSDWIGNNSSVFSSAVGAFFEIKPTENKVL